MPKIQAITDEMKAVANRIGDNVSFMQSSHTSVKNCMSSILVHFDSTPKVLTTLHLSNVTQGYRNLSESLNGYREFLINAAETYEWNDEQLARWKNTSIGERIDNISSTSIASNQDNSSSTSGENPTSTSETSGDLQPANFEKAMEMVFFSEGGYSNDPDDPGGATNMGITQGTLNNAYQSGIVSHNDVTRLSQNEAMEIYRKMYWEASNADKMPEPLATIYFDSVVLFGTYTGGRLLQRAMESLGQSIVVDGNVGPQTLAALNEKLKTSEDVNSLCSKMLDIRQGWHNNDAYAWKYLAGWTNRVNRMRDLIA